MYSEVKIDTRTSRWKKNLSRNGEKKIRTGQTKTYCLPGTGETSKRARPERMQRQMFPGGPIPALH